MERGFKYRIYPNACQREQIARTLGCCRFVYNRALDVNAARNILAEGKRVLSNTEGTAGHAGTVAAVPA